MIVDRPRKQTDIPVFFNEFEPLAEPLEHYGARRLNIGVDIDGVLFPYHKPYEEMYKDHHCPVRNKPLRNFMHNLSESAIANALKIDRGEMFRSKDDYLNSPETINSVLPILGSVEALGSLATVHNVWLISSRVPGVKDSTIEWLDRNYDTSSIKDLILLGDEKVGAYAGKGKAFKKLALDVHVDDMPKHLNEARTAGVTGRILFARYPWNTPNTAPGSHRAVSWLQAISLVNQTFELVNTNPRQIVA